MHMQTFSSYVFTAALFLFVQSSFAQILPREDQQTDAGLEDLYDKFEETEASQQATKKSKEAEEKKNQEVKVEKDLSKLSELSSLLPFNDIAVIQKKFLPKTARFEFSGSGLFSTNNQYYSNLGIGLRGAYYFTEKYGVEATYIYLTSAERPITEGLVDNQRISTQSLVEPESYMGLSFKWTPWYGKIAWFQQKIVPFEFYFTPGFGMTGTANGDSNATMSLGAGQLFALSKSMAARWDLTWNYYSADVTVNGAVESQAHSDILLGVGISFFYPEATYR